MGIKKNMKIRIKRIDKSLPLPRYYTKGAVCFDLLAREDITINAGEVKLIPCNIIIEVPEGYMFILAQRSSTALKKGLLMSNGIGIIDQDYSGPNDELKYQAYNFTKESVEIKMGERVVQGCFVPIAKAEFEEMEIIEGGSRGGFGSTG